MSEIGFKQRLKDLTRLRFNLLPTGKRFGIGRYECYKWLMESQYWSADQLREFQWQRLTQLLQHAYDNTEFYRERFQAVGAEPGDIKCFEDFRKLPYLTKEDVRQNLDKLKCRNLDQHRPFDIRTGGSSGAPLRMFKSHETEHMRKGCQWRSFAWGGVDFRDMHITIANTFSFEGIDYPWWVDHRTRTILVKTIRMDEELFQRYLGLHRRYRPTYFFGSVGFLRVLGKYVEEHGISDIESKAVFVVGETVTPEDRRNVKKWFGCDLYDYYGLRENAASASECEHFNMHINSEFTLVEFEHGGKPTASGEPGDIIGTNLFNFATPVIRYFTEDLGSSRDAECPCGRKLPLMRMKGGRTRDYLSSRRGKFFITWHLIQIIDESMAVEALQLHQLDINNVKVRIVKKADFTKADEKKIVETLCKITQGELKFTVEYVDEIPRTKLGKFLFVKSDIRS